MKNDIDLLDLDNDIYIYILNMIGGYVKNDNIRKIRKERSEKNKECACGCVLSKSSLSIHKKTIQHLKLIEQIKPTNYSL